MKRQKRGNMKYLVIGAGGTGGPIGGFLTKAGKDVTLIARGEHLNKMQTEGLKFDTPEGCYTVAPIRACTMEEYQEKPDVIFVCVKGYSLEDTIPFIRRVAGSDTIVIPILNIYGTGGRLQQSLSEIPVTDGCIYIAAEIKEPGELLMSGKIFRVVYGLRKGTDPELAEKIMPVLKQVKSDLEESGIDVIFSGQIEKDALQKFSFVSPMAGLGAYYNVPAFAFQAKGQMRSSFIAMMRELKELSDAMGVSLPENIEEINLNILDNLAPNATASMQRDIRDGKQSEIDGLVFEVIRLGKQYGVETPVYEMVAEKFL